MIFVKQDENPPKPGLPAWERARQEAIATIDTDERLAKWAEIERGMRESPVVSIEPNMGEENDGNLKGE